MSVLLLQSHTPPVRCPETHLLDFQIALQQFHFFLDGKHLFSLIQGNPVEAGQILTACIVCFPPSRIASAEITASAL